MSFLNSAVITGIDDLLTVYSKKDRRFEIKNRKNCGISFCKRGKITYLSNGKNYVSDSKKVVFLPEGATYEGVGNETGLFPVINFTVAGKCPDTIQIFHINNPKGYIKDFLRIKEMMLFSHNNAACMSLLYDMFDRIDRESRGKDSVVSPALEYIEGKYSQTGLSNAKLASLCSVSEVYLRRLFLKEYGMTPHKYLVFVRIKAAKQLLADSEEKVTDISEKCGFSSVYHFCRVFKEMTSFSPTEYRDKFRRTITI